MRDRIKRVWARLRRHPLGIAVGAILALLWAAFTTALASKIIDRFLGGGLIKWLTTHTTGILLMVVSALTWTLAHLGTVLALAVAVTLAYLAVDSFVEERRRYVFPYDPSAPTGFLNWEVEGHRALVALGKIQLRENDLNVRTTKKFNRFNKDLQSAVRKPNNSVIGLRISDDIAKTIDIKTVNSEENLRDYKANLQIASDFLPKAAQRWVNRWTPEDVAGYRATLTNTLQSTSALKQSTDNNKASILGMKGASQTLNAAVDRHVALLDQWVDVHGQVQGFTTSMISVMDGGATATPLAG
jgi:hypothetical protein